MKRFIYLFFILILLSTGCAMLKREVERSVKKDVQEYFEDHFHLYAGDYHNERTKTFKNNLGWYIGIVGSILGIIGGVIGIGKWTRENKNKKVIAENSEYFEGMKNNKDG